jgi:DNA-binding response OmpR family regulator
MLSCAPDKQIKDSLLDAVGEPPLPLILIVEDHDDTRMMYRFVLETSSYRVAEAKNGEDGVSLALRLRPSLIVMDSNLPGMDGLMVARYLRSHLDGNRIPILFLSGDAHPQLRIAALNAGGDEYLVKPVSIDQFQATIAKLLSPAAQKKSATQGFE